MNNSYTDLALTNVGPYYDISFSETGDFNLTRGLSTSLTATFFTDQRADSSEVSAPEKRRGWWGNLFKFDDSYPDLGSKLWLLEQSVINQDLINNAIAYTQLAYSWLTTLNYADKVNVSATTNGIVLTIMIEIIQNNNIIDSQTYELWANTVNELAANE